MKTWKIKVEYTLLTRRSRPIPHHKPHLYVERHTRSYIFSKPLHLLHRTVAISSLWIAIAVKHLVVTVHVTGHCERQRKSFNIHNNMGSEKLTLSDRAVPAPACTAALSKRTVLSALRDVIFSHNVQAKRHGIKECADHGQPPKDHTTNDELKNESNNPHNCKGC
jgi:hypothetical protein